MQNFLFIFQHLMQDNRIFPANFAYWVRGRPVRSLKMRTGRPRTQ